MVQLIMNYGCLEVVAFSVVFQHINPIQKTGHINLLLLKMLSKNSTGQTTLVV